MSTTKRSDLVIVSEVLQAAVAGQLAGMTVLNGSPAAIINASLPDSARGGDTVKIPYFAALSEMEDVSEGDALTPAKVSETSETATVQRAGKAFESSVWSSLAADPRSDPYTEAARQLKELITRRVDKALLDAALVAEAAMTADVYSSSAPRTMDYAAYLQGRALWGDEQNDIAMMVVHSKVLFDMYALKDSTGRPLLIDSISADQMPRFLGTPVYVTDRLTASTDSPAKYTSLLIKKNALAFWYNGMPFVDDDKDILAHTRVTAVNMYFAAKKYSRLVGTTHSGVCIIKTN